MATTSAEVVIQGVTESGHCFRPGDWAERLCRVMAVFGEDRKIQCLSHVKPIIAGGISCIVIDRTLEEAAPEAYRFLLDFARDNRLISRSGRRAPRLEDAGGSADAPRRARLSD